MFYQINFIFYTVKHTYFTLWYKYKTISFLTINITMITIIYIDKRSTSELALSSDITVITGIGGRYIRGSREMLHTVLHDYYHMS